MSLKGSEKLGNVKKADFAKFVKEELFEIIKQLDKEVVDDTISKIFSSKIEKEFDVINGAAGVKQILTGEIAKQKREERISAMLNVEGIILGKVDVQRMLNKKTQIILLEPDKKLSVFNLWGGSVGDRRSSIEVPFGREIKGKIDSYEPPDKSYKIWQIHKIDEVVADHSFEDVIKILEKREIPLDLRHFDLRNYVKYESHIIDAPLTGFRPVPILRQDSNDQWYRAGWESFSQVNKHGDQIYVFQAILRDDTVSLTVNFRPQVLGEQLIDIGHEKHFEAAIERFTDPGKEPVKDGFCFDEDGQINSNVCITSCSNCIYGFISRLAGTEKNPKRVRAILQAGKDREKDDSEGVNITYIDCEGYALLSTEATPESKREKVPVKEKEVERPPETEEKQTLFDKIKGLVWHGVTELDMVMESLPKKTSKTKVEKLLTKAIADWKKESGAQAEAAGEEKEFDAVETSTDEEYLKEILEYLGEEGKTANEVAEKFKIKVDEAKEFMTQLADKDEAYEVNKKDFKYAKL